MPPKTKKPKQQERSEQTRKAILAAALVEFSSHGLSGARTEAIAKSAGANKALLYYYFKSKQGLYAATLEEVSKKVIGNALLSLDPKYSPGEQLLRSALVHFDRILTQREFQSLLQQEMVRFHRKEHATIPRFFQVAFRPLTDGLRKAAEDGMRSGELCKADPYQVTYAMFGANVFYFMSAPMMREVLPFSPLAPEALQARREAAVAFLGNALFTDRAHGQRLVRKVLRAMPMPEFESFELTPGTQVRRHSK